jgi:hypothetical protein
MYELVGLLDRLMPRIMLRLLESMPRFLADVVHY